MYRNVRILYALASSILLSLAWIPGFSGLYILIGFVPILLIEDELFTKNKTHAWTKVFYYALLTFFIWNILTTSWIAHASTVGMVTAVITNAFLFSVVFTLFHVTRKQLGNVLGYSSLVIYWVTFEYLYLNAEISWPWLNLGNAFAQNTQLVQWYEYTGTLGGTAWILLSNIFLFILLNKISSKNIGYLLRFTPFYLIVTLLPILTSIKIYYDCKEEFRPLNVTLVQPNFDSYNNNLTTFEECEAIVKLANRVSNDSTYYIIAPEACINGNFNENTIANNQIIKYLATKIASYKNAKLIIGALTFSNNSESTVEAQPNKYMRYNSALQISTNDSISIYHKSKLVVGIEKMPYAGAFKFLKPLLEYSGGSYESYGTQAYREVFTSKKTKAKVGVVICYESVYGEFVTEYIKNGANVLFIITNDGWWGNTFGYRQHLSYARLRAIETRRYIARAANTGFSAFINQRGDILASTEWNTPTALNATVNLNSAETFYVKHGDYLGRIALVFSIIFITLTLLSLFNYKHSANILFVPPEQTH